MTSSIPATKFGKLHYKALERNKIQSLRISKRNFEASMTLPEEAKQDILWWIADVHHMYGVLSISNPSFTLKTDALKTGLGAVLEDH